MRFTAISASTCLVLFLAIFQLETTESAKILTISVMSSKSHKITYEPLLRELARRGHEITVLSPIVGKNETNYRNIQMASSDEFLGSAGNMFEVKLTRGILFETFANPFFFIGPRLVGLCTKGYESPQVQQVLKEKYDLIFFTHMFNECLYGLLHKMNTTTIVFQQSPVFPYVVDTLGTPSPPSFVSSVLIGYPDQMTFGQRLWNFYKTGYNYLAAHYYYYPLMEKIYRQALNDPTLPSITEILKNTSLIMTNSHITYQRPRPLMPDVIEVGGMHLNPPKPVVPKELDDFLSGAKDGFIYFSMGSALKGSSMPENYRKMFLNVFSKLKQRVLWKWEDEMSDLPANVKISQWLPQQDVLGHKNLRMFMTHGGLGSTAESIYHGVPLLGIPMFGDQPSNLRKANIAGFALPPLTFSDLTEEILLDAINTLLNDPSYRENAKKQSRIFLDQLNKPLDTAVYWVEYVLRHQGATHLRSAARDLNTIQYFSLDVIAVFLLIGLVSSYINFLILRAIYRKLFGAKPVSSKKKNK